MLKKSVENYQVEEFGDLFVRVWLGVVLSLGVVLTRGPPAVPWVGATPASRSTGGGGPGGLQENSITIGIPVAPRAAIVLVCPSIWTVLIPGAELSCESQLRSQTTPPVFVRSS
jgi:hypothetical protein